MTRLLLILSMLLASPAWSATIFNDTFTDTDGTDLVAHTPDTGTSWTEIHDTGTQVLGISSNVVIPETTSSTRGAVNSADATYSTADYTVTATFGTVTGGASDGVAWIGCRFDNTGGWDGYLAGIIQPDNTNDVRIYRIDNNVATKISSTEDATPTSGDVFQLECNGSAIGLKKNGSYVISPITDATYSAAGVAVIGNGEVFGLSAFGSRPDTDITTFLVETIESASFGPLRRRML